MFVDLALSGRTIRGRKSLDTSIVDAVSLPADRPPWRGRAWREGLEAGTWGKGQLLRANQLDVNRHSCVVLLARFQTKGISMKRYWVSLYILVTLLGIIPSRAHATY